MSGAGHDVFVGRAREIAALRAGLAAAAEGRGRAIILVGEPGIGKTRTAQELAVLARARGFEVLSGRCFEGEGAPAFWPWVQVLRAYVDARDPATLAAELGTSAPDVAAVCPELRERLPDLPAPALLEPGQARFRFFEGVATALSRAARTRPIVLTLDDLQGMDEPSLLLLGFLARTLRDTPILIVGGARSVAFAADHPLADTLGGLVREQVMDLLGLGGLSEGEVEALLASVAGQAPPAGLAGAVHARTEGNPLYVREVARMLATRGGLARASQQTRLEIPDTVRLAIARNLRDLSTECRELLTLAALFGREFRREALLRASGLERDHALGLLDEAEAARVIGPIPGDSDRRRFGHALFAETLAESLSSAARATLHRRAAESLADDPRAEEHAAEIAHHWLEAGLSGDPEEAVGWACRAAERALALLAHEEAARLFRMALAALDSSSSPDDARRAEVLLGLGEAHKRAGETAEAKAAFLEAAAVARRLGSAELLTRAALGFAPPMPLGEQPEPDAAVIRILEEAIDTWQAGRDSGLHSCALARMAAALVFGEGERREALSERAYEMARRVGEPKTLRYVLAARLTMYLARHDAKLRLAMATELVRLAEDAADVEALAVGRLWRTVHLLETGDAAAMRREERTFARLAQELRRPVWSWYASMMEGMGALHDGRFEDAERAIAEALRVGDPAVPYAARAYFVATMLVLRILEGRPTEFAAEYRGIFEAHPDPRALSALAWAESEQGNVAEARRIVDFLTADLAGIAQDIIWIVSVCFLAEGCAFLEDAPRAAQLYAFLATTELESVVWAESAPLGPVAHYLGLLARTVGRLDHAATHFEAAIAIATRDASPPFLARAQYEYARLLRRRGADGDTTRARALLGDAREIADAIGMEGLRAKIDALGELPRAAPDEEPSPHVFRFDGGFWTIASFGKEIRLRDMRGLRFLAHLLRAPGREFHASDLASALDARPLTALPRDPALTVVGGLGDAGELLDARARAAYRQRLATLDEERADAERHSDLGELGRASAEREALLAELAAAAHGRRAASHAERSRIAVTKAIGAALEKIALGHPELGAHLSATIRRGYFCAYLPDPRVPVEWES